MAKKNRSKGGVVQWAKKNVGATAILVAIVAVCVYLGLQKPYTPQQGLQIENMEKTCASMRKRAESLRGELAHFDKAHSKEKELWDSFTPWQRTSTLSEVHIFLTTKDFDSSVSDILNSPNLPQMWRAASPDVFDKGFTEEGENVFGLLQSWLKGTSDGAGAMGQDAFDKLQNTIKAGFWRGMESFDDADQLYFSTLGWTSIRHLMLSRFLVVFRETIQSKLSLHVAGEELVWPEEPVPEPAWSDSESAKDVVHLTDASFEEELAGKDHAIVMFYAPWCGHCKTFKPHYEEAATALKDAGHTNVALAATDSTEHTKVAKKFDVKGYPTLKYFQKGELVGDFEGKRTAFGVVDWLSDAKRMGESVAGVAKSLEPAPEPQWGDEPDARDVVHMTDDSFASDIKANPYSLVMFYAPWCGHCKTFKPEFAAAATALNEADWEVTLGAVDATKHPKSAAEFDVKGYPTVLYFENGEMVSKFNGARTEDGIIDFLSDDSRMGAATEEEEEGADDEGDTDTSQE